MINRLIKTFVFDEKIRSGLTFSDDTKIRLNTEDKVFPRIELKKQSTELYSLDADLYVETPFMTPNAVKQWLMFEGLLPDDTQPIGTTIKYRLKTAAGEFYWNGAWVVAGASDWSTEDEINTNINTLAVDATNTRSLAVLVNLQTTDQNVTPQVKEVKILGQMDIDFLDDIVYNCVVRKLNTSFRSSSQIELEASGASNFDLSTVLENTGYNITGIRSVYDLTDDPGRYTNLFNSYVPGAAKSDGFTNKAGTVNFTSSPTSGNFLEVTFEFVPEIIIKTDQDFNEVSVFPSLVFENILSTGRDGFFMPGTNSNGRDMIRDKVLFTGVLQFAPRQESIRFDYAIFTNMQIDQMRLVQDFNAFLENNRILQTWGLDEQVDLNILKSIDTSRNRASKESGGADDKTNTNTADGSFELLAVPSYDKVSININIVKQLVTSTNLKT